MAVETKIITCAKCRKACKLTVTVEDTKVINVEGNRCSRGEKYALEELNSPKEGQTSLMEKIKNFFH